jgi:hypothetical protein
MSDSLDRPRPSCSVDCFDPNAAPLPAQRRLLAYSGATVKTYTSGGYRIVAGQLKRSKKVLAIRGANINHNHDLKSII